MSLNCNEINRILSEIDFKFAFIQEITQTGFDTLGFRIITHGSPVNFIICTQSSSCRINVTEQKFPKNKKPLRFNEFLKSRVQGMRINDVHQIGLERIIKFDISTWKEKLFMYVRLWSNAANVIVTDEENRILDCMFRRPKKGEVSGGLFTVEEKEVSEEEKKLSLEKFPVRRELLELAESACPFPFNRAVDKFYTEQNGSLSREALLLQAEKWFNVRHSKMLLALENLEKKKASFENASALKHTGDLILTFQSQINGAVLDCTDFETGKEVHIRLDKNLSAHENAAVYYEQYKKAVSGMDALLHDIELSKKALKTLEDEYEKILKEQNVLKIEQLLRKDTTPKQKEEKVFPGLCYNIGTDGKSGEWRILVGRTASENDELLRHYVRGNDLWLHTRDFAGGYVFIKAKSGKSFPLEIMLYAGNLAVYHSKARKNRSADLYYTEVKHLRRAKNGPKGLVLPTHEKNLFIKIDDEKLRALDELVH